MTAFKNFGLFLEKNPKYLYGFIVILLFPALLINLGLYPFNLDEATRAVVALEMKFSGNYLIPTINGEFYYNKPPLFNWFQLFFVNFTGSMEEWVFRMPVIVSLLGFGLTVFLTLRKETNSRIALLAAFAVITSGRILFYDSFKGLIDISFSWIIYLNFWTIYNNFRKERFLRLFAFSWLLTALGFLLKGMPALVFQGISLLVYFTSQKSFRKLFSIHHFTGALSFLVPVGLYLFLYNQENSLSYYITNLWTESAKRTPISNTLISTVKHFFAFPLNFIFYFLPWSVLVVVLFSGKVIALVKKEGYLVFLAIVFISNILVYWISPAIYPRYLFMFLPSFFAILSFAYFKSGDNSPLKKYFLHPYFHLIALVVVLSCFSLGFILDSSQFEHFGLKITVLCILALILSALYLRFSSERVFILIGFILLIRIGFNFFAFDDRLKSGIDEYQKTDTIAMARSTMGKPLYLYENCPIHNSSTFYIERERMEILARWRGEMTRGNLYIVPEKQIPELPQHKVLTVFETNLYFLKLAVIEIQ